jgi:PadR family transcriptional regulator
MERLGEIELLSLLAVARTGEGAYGVGLLDEIRSFSGREPSVAAVYAALERLERQGLVRMSLSDPLPARGGRARRQYRVTATGRAHLRRERATAMRMWRLEPLADDPGPW